MFFQSRRSSKPKKLYLMERNGRSRWFWSNGTREIKIGISIDPEKRRKEVDEGIPGKIEILKIYDIDNALKVEQELLKRYKKYQFIPRGAKRGAGKTEFVKLTDNQLNDIKKELRKKSQSSELPERLIVSLIFTAITLFFILSNL